MRSRRSEESFRGLGAKKFDKRPILPAIFSSDSMRLGRVPFWNAQRQVVLLASQLSRLPEISRSCI